MSQPRALETSAGERGNALLSGSSACSMRSRIGGFSGSGSPCHPRARKRVPRTDEGANAAAAKENTATTIVTNTIIASPSGDMNLNLYTNYLANPKITDRLQRNAADHQRMSKGIGKQWTNKTRTHEEHYHHDDRRQ